MSALLELMPGVGTEDVLPHALKHVVSPKTFEGVRQARKLKTGASPSEYQTLTTTSDEKIFDAVAAAKVTFARVAMHLPREWRESAFAQLDALHDVAEWEEDDKPIAQNSFATFLRALILLEIRSFPSLGMSPEGNVLAAWIAAESDRLMIEFLPDNRVQWTVVQMIAEELEPTSGRCIVKRLPELLAPHGPDKWFAG